MKTTTLIALLAAVSAVSVGAISMNTSPSFALATGTISPEAGTMMGHVEYVLYDADNNVKSYIQSDNMVVNRGDDCVLAYAFNPSNTAGTDNCATNANGFRFIGIGNATATVSATATTLTNTASTFASSGVGGLMSMREDPTIVFGASSDGGTATIATASPFTFVSGVNSTTVLSAGLFDSICTQAAGTCTAAYPANMFSVQSVSVIVTGGDSLDVTWTITVGNSS